ncbi:MAG: MFS transporter, partial [Beijerinckiaceae bacterium]|nr:MFS transporter [Beijerinckiaceae bacterium]
EQLQQASMQTAPQILVLSIAAIVSLILLLRRESSTPHPLIPLALLRKSAIWRSDALAACHGAALVSIITFVPVYMRVVRDASASDTGLLLLPIAIGIGSGSLITGRLVSRTGRTMIFPSIAMIPVVAMLIYMAVRLDTLSLTAIAVLLGLIALFMGSVMGVVNVTVQTAAGPSNLGAAAGSVQFSRAVGATFGTAIVSALLFSVLVSRDPTAAQYFGALIEEGPAALKQLTPVMRAAVQGALAETFTDVFLLIAFYGMMALALAWSNPARRF